MVILQFFLFRKYLIRQCRIVITFYRSSWFYIYDHHIYAQRIVDSEFHFPNRKSFNRNWRNEEIASSSKQSLECATSSRIKKTAYINYVSMYNLKGVVNKRWNKNKISKTKIIIIDLYRIYWCVLFIIFQLFLLFFCNFFTLSHFVAF